MMHDTQVSPVIEHSELIDMRTHLTVAMLAASQLHRRTKNVPEAAHLQNYLDQSLKSLVEDVVRVDAMMAQADESVHAAEEQAPSRLPKPVRWGFGGWMHRRRLVRLTVSYPTEYLPSPLLPVPAPVTRHDETVPSPV